MPTFEGNSAKANLHEAIEEAIKKALSSTTRSDAMIVYTVTKIGGRKGGFGGLNELAVTIEAEIH